MATAWNKKEFTFFRIFYFQMKQTKTQDAQENITRL